MNLYFFCVIISLSLIRTVSVRLLLVHFATKIILYLTRRVFSTYFSLFLILLPLILGLSLSLSLNLDVAPLQVRTDSDAGLDVCSACRVRKTTSFKNIKTLASLIVCVISLPSTHLCCCVCIDSQYGFSC